MLRVQYSTYGEDWYRRLFATSDETSVLLSMLHAQTTFDADFKRHTGECKARSAHKTLQGAKIPEQA